MKAVILAAGESKRLHPYTLNMPKCLLEIGGKTIIGHQIESLKRNGINEITIVTGFCNEKLKRTLGEGFSFIHNKDFKNTSSIYSLWLAKENLLGNSFVILNSDVEVTENWISPIIELMETDKNIAACMPKIKSYANNNFFEYAGAAGGFIDKFGYPFCRGRILSNIEEDNGQYDDKIGRASCRERV